MCYRCSICEEPVGANQKRRVHRPLRDDGSVSAELPVCISCDAGLRSGYTLAQMRSIVGPKKSVPDALRHVPHVAAAQAGPVTEAV